MLAMASFRKKYWSHALLTLALFCFMILMILFNNIVHLRNLHFSSQFSIDEDTVVIEITPWKFNKSRNPADYIFPDHTTAIISGKNICSSDNPPRVIIFLCSELENFLPRLAIRETWARTAYEKFNIRIVFLMGLSENEQINKKIKNESEIYNDVIVENFIDTYDNLTIKSLMLLKWVKNNCNNATYIMKAEDDVYINMNNLNQLLDSIPENNTQNILLGKLFCATPTKVYPEHWNEMPELIHPTKKYIEYVSGVGYFMSRQVALKLYDEAFRIPLIHMEDIYVTGLCARRAGIRPNGQLVFEFQEMKDINEINCSVTNDYLIVYSHGILYGEMYYIHNMLNTCSTTKKFLYLNTTRYFCKKKKKLATSGTKSVFTKK